ncbi:protealysin inhibitor emfourin [Larsenimonas suaedae]|uniref:Uncharacterized protein n=1 Tax=Larsenimonas suaedae TaxID=1851019 RepID=A0ABU1GZP0_9GAMM|nr:protealysin inhibitor emfourin [Larsenimonas suaedae]MCM2972873.1 hypothetical protein [Larsenimonas suaedae]MDR5896972.1 hypothetical protein [Larsenimonas suaedae]
MTRFEDLSRFTRVCITREGGLVAAPGLMRPRTFDVVECSLDEQNALCHWLNEGERIGRQASPGRGDQRYFRICLYKDRDGEASPDEELNVPEDAAPAGVKALWEEGRIEPL